AGGPTTPELVAAVSNAGGLGSLGAAYLAPDVLRETIRQIRQLTDRPYSVNLFLPETPEVSDEQIAQAEALLAPFRAELGLPEPSRITRPVEQFDAQLAVLLEERVPVVSFTFGVPAPQHIRAVKDAGLRVVGTATTVAEGRLLQNAGVDAIVGQGSEAGGHRGTFESDEQHMRQALVGVMALIPQLVDAVRGPVIAAGGIMDGRGMVAALALGAAGVQMGTAFLACPESGAHMHHKAALLGGTDESTVITRAFSGRPARGLANRFTEELAAHAAELAPFPVQNALTRDIRQAGAQQNRPEYLSMWAGQGAPLATTLPAAEVVWATMEQARRVIAQLAENGLIGR
ncbi:MAG: NAD(P)H-dependent flavin oxidoreductase, partial [Ktedonobacterales bacterium]